MIQTFVECAARHFRLVATTVLAVGIVLSCAVNAVLAQDSPSTPVKAYSIRHLSAAEMQNQLRPLVTDAFPNTRIGVDSESNRVLISGSDAAQKLAEQFILAIDKAVKTPAAPFSNEKPELKPYEIAPDQLQMITEQFSLALSAHENVRVMSDARTSQLLVMAPPAVQRWIESQLPKTTANGTTAALTPIQRSQDRISRTQTTLKHIDTSDLEKALGDFVREKLNVQRSANGRQSTITLPSQNDEPVVLRIDNNGRVVEIQGPTRGVNAWMAAIKAIDAPRTSSAYTAKLISLGGAHRPSVTRAINVLKANGQQANGQAANGNRIQVENRQPLFVAQVNGQIQRGNANDDEAAGETPENGSAENDNPASGDNLVGDNVDGDTVIRGGGLVGDVQIEYVEGSDLIAIRGHDRDVQRVIEIINQIQALSAETIPKVEIVPLTHVNSSAMSDLVNELYEDVYESRQGPVSITALVKPNSLLLIGREENVQVISDLVKRLDQPVDPTSQFHVFRLQHIAAANAQQTIQNFFGDPGDGGGGGGQGRRSNPGDQGPGQPGAQAPRQNANANSRGLAVRVRATADVRSNSLIVRASPRDLAEVQRLIRKIDVETSAVVNRVEIFQLKNSRAEELAPVLQQAISGQAANQPGGRRDRGGDEGEFSPQRGGAGDQTASRSAMLTFSRIGPEGEQLLRSGIMSDVRVSADPATNSLIITAPEKAMQLIFALIDRLDQLPSTESRIKVFQLENGDATAMKDLLEELFPPPTAGNQAGGGRTASSEGNLVPLKFSVDQRTNSIIASGTQNDLTVARAIIINLDSSEVRERSNDVYRLRYANAAFVANAIQEFLRSEQQRTQQQIQAFTQNAQGSVGPFEQIEREVVVVAEELTNTLIISATPRFHDQIMHIVEEIDAVPPMVMIQVLIAEIELNDTAEFGVELGIQDSLLFDRGSVLGGSINQSSLTSGEKVGGQGLTDFSLGRANADVGFGGLVLSAGNESINVLMRALQEERRIDILSRPQIMTLDNQPARIQVGADVRIASGTNVTLNGLTNLVTEQASIGLILDVVPRISPDGTVFMFLRAEKSALGSEATGTPIAISDDGLVVRSPRINITLAETSISVPNGQTAVFSGLLTQETSTTSRQVPMLGDLPLLGDFFRYDQVANRRTELMIILTPHIVYSQDDLARVSHTESSRMSWCLADVASLHGDMNLASQTGYLNDAAVMTVFPDGQPGTSANGPTNRLEHTSPYGVQSYDGNQPLPLIEPGSVEPSANPLDPPLPVLEPPTVQAPFESSTSNRMQRAFRKFDIRQRFAARQDDVARHQDITRREYVAQQATVKNENGAVMKSGRIQNVQPAGSIAEPKSQNRVQRALFPQAVEFQEKESSESKSQLRRLPTGE